MGVQRHFRTLAGTVSAAVLLAALLGQAQAPAAAGRPGPNATNAALWTAFDGDKDGSVTRAEMKGAFEKWYDAADTAKSGSVTTDQLGPALNTAWRCRRRRRRRLAADAAGGGATRSAAPRAAAAAICRPSDRRPAPTT